MSLIQDVPSGHANLFHDHDTQDCSDLKQGVKKFAHILRRRLLYTACSTLVQVGFNTTTFLELTN